jgi:cysteinyl-tRNA synthetase
MSTCTLGEHFDIHGGGMDLKFPHHENEIAQSEAATGEKFVNYWIHNGFVQVDEEKMSKSLGNFFTVREVLKRYRPEEVRFFILGSHYRSPLNYTEENLNKARGGLTRLYTALRGLPVREEAKLLDDVVAQFHAAMDDDFNTPEAIAVLFELANALNRARKDSAASVSNLSATLRFLGGSLGMLAEDAETYLRSGSVTEDALSDAEIEQLIAKRSAAREMKDWQESDRIREQLKGNGVVLEDGPTGTTWRRD